VTKNAICLPFLQYLQKIYVCFFCTVTYFSAAEKDRGVKFCMHVRVLSGQVFNHFDDLWLAGNHGGGIGSGMSYKKISVVQSELGAVAWRTFGIGAAA